MAAIHPKKREKAFRMRLEQRSLREIASATGVSEKTLSRWENGWVDARGRKHAGWKGELDRAFREKAEHELQFGLLVKEERLKTYEELARLAVAKVKQIFPQIRGRTALDAKALLSEIRELCRLIATEKGEVRSGSQTVIAVKTDITLTELQERYRSVHADREQGSPQPGGTEPLAGDDGGVPPGSDRDG